MLDKKSKETLKEIAFNEDSKPKDRVSASKLLLSLGIEETAVCGLLHGFVDNPHFPDSLKVKSIELLDKFEMKQTEEQVEDVEDKRKKILEMYNL